MLYEHQSTDNLRGVGGKISASFSEMGIDCIKDLLEYYPSRHIDRGLIRNSLAGVNHGDKAFVRGKALSGGRTNYISRNFTKTVLMFECESGRFSAVFYNQPYRKNSHIVGEEYVLYGTVDISKGGALSLNPAPCERADRIVNLTEGLCAVYRIPKSCKITLSRLKNTIKTALECVNIEEEMPFWVTESLGVSSRSEALRGIHFPQSQEDLADSLRYILSMKFMGFLISLMHHRNTILRNSSVKINTSGTEDFLRRLPYTLTPAQDRALNEILSDISSPSRMNRLLQGDVGSGKTAVAMAAAYAVVADGHQVAFTAPTEILARQHYENYAPMLEEMGIKAGLIYSAMGAKERTTTLSALKNGEINILFGTHAVFSKDVEYSDLAFIIIDEQHRYGVSQRASLESKGRFPHVLVMSATPIPRTLALCYYKDLDVSVIDSLPAGRKKVATYLVDDRMEKRLLAFAKKIMDQKEKVYVVCPAVDDEDMINVHETYMKFSKIFSDYGVGCITGQMNKDEKIKAMKDISDGKVNMLIATSLIEVGIDVPDATLMWVKGCERFGLSQLHQLRGRVGRSSLQSRCVLQMSEYSESCAERLGIMTKTNDGFEIASEDLRQRGSGDVLGYEQSGHSSEMIEEAMNNTELFFRVNEVCEKLLSSDKEKDVLFVQKILRDTVTDRAVVLN